LQTQTGSDQVNRLLADADGADGVGPSQQIECIEQSALETAFFRLKPIILVRKRPFQGIKGKHPGSWLTNESTRQATPGQGLRSCAEVRGHGCLRANRTLT
jgi:hypothetical protein